MDLHLASTLLFYARIVFVVLPCPGYIHPDEFFQSGEPMAKEVLNLKSTLTWEWTSDHPIRNALFPILSSGVPFAFLKLLRYILGFHWCSALLVIAPRLFGLVNIHIIEKCLVRLLKMDNRGSKFVHFTLFLFRSSFVTLIMLPRTFSNVLETTMFSVLLLLVMEYATKSSKTLNFSLALLVAAGCFVRPTFVIFSVYPLLTLLLLVLKKRQMYTFAKFTCFISIGGLVGSMLMVLIDHQFYSTIKGYSCWPITPLNFFMYNSNKANLSEHGTHPWYLHFTVNMMLLYAPLYMFFVQDLLRGTWKKLKTFRTPNQVLHQDEDKSSSRCDDRTDFEVFMLRSILVPLVLLSFVPHQEPRFLLPVFVPLLLIVAPRLCSALWCSRFLKFWFMFNIVCGVWFGFLHQGGVYKSLADMNENLRVSSLDTHGRNRSIHLVFWRTYMAPQHLLGIDQAVESVHLINLGGSSYQNITDLVKELRRDGLQHLVWLFCPGVLHSRVSEHFLLQRQYFPHVSTEDLPVNIFDQVNRIKSNDSSFLSFFTLVSNILIDNLSLNGYQLLIQ